MIIYKDIFTGDELFTDSFPMKCIDDTYYEVEGASRTDKDEFDDRLIGGNKSAEAADGDDGVDASVVTGINIVLTHNLVETFVFDKKTYFSGCFKPYLKRILEKLKKDNPEKVAAFQEKMKAFAPVLKAKLKSGDFQFFLGATLDSEAMVCLLGYRDDQTTPYFIYFKDGLEEEKA